MDRARVPNTARLSRVLVTGADGVIGRIVRTHLADRFELSYLTRRRADFPSHVADITDMASIQPAFEGVDAVLHLAAASSAEAEWETVLPNNIIGTYNVIEAARRAGVARFVFASSNHAAGMDEIDGAPEIYRQAQARVYESAPSIRPDSLYGVTKVFGEAVARMYADRHGLSAICLRIGAVREHDDPDLADDRLFSGLPALSADEARARLRAAWLSHRDCAQLIRRALETRAHWALVYGVSDNAGRFWDLDGARELLGYEPADSAG